MYQFEEVRGASERPGGCIIRLSEAEDGATFIDIPPRGALFPVAVFGGLLLIILLAVFFMGAELFFAHRSVLVMAQIAPKDLPRSMQRYEAWMVLGWIVMEGLGVWTLAAIVRPLFARETLTIGPDTVEHQRRIFGWSGTRSAPRSALNRFNLERDPQGFLSSVLTLKTPQGDWIVAEHVDEADREWLASAGNALLARRS